MRTTAWIATIFLCTACTVQSAEPVETQLARMAKIDRFVLDGELFLKDKSLSAIRKLEPPKKESVKKESNPYDAAQSYEYRTFRFEGLEIYGLVRPSDQFWPVHVTVTDARWKILNGLDVGTSATKIAEVLGQPNKIVDNILQ